MDPQIKDKLCNEIIKEPTKDHFRKFLKNNLGEFNGIDFKNEWIDKGKLAKIILAMANSNGGIIIVGVREDKDGNLIFDGLDNLKDKADIDNEISKFIPRNLNYEVFNFSYDSSEYKEIEGKKFQLLIVYNTPDRLPFVSLSEKKGSIDKDVIYVRRATKCEKANANDIEKILEKKVMTIFKDSKEMSLDEHLLQLKKLYNELPKKINVLIKKGEPSALSLISNTIKTLYKTSDKYEEQDNPNYPDETYEEFILNMIKDKKLKIKIELGL